MTLRAHDFAKSRLPAEWGPRLETWFRSALTLADRACARELAFAFDSELQDLNVVRPAELVASRPEGSVAYRMHLGAERFPTLLLVPRPLLLLLVSGLLGEVPNGMPADRDLTLIEQNLAEYHLLAHWLPAFRTTWPGPNQLVWQQGSTEPPPQAVRIFGADDEAIQFTWIVRGTFGALPITWLFRRAGLGELLGLSTPPTATAVAPPIDAVVQALPIDVVVALGSVELRLSELSHLQPGDVIMLNQRISEPLAATVGDTTKFRGWAGRNGSSFAYKIHSLAEDNA